MANPTFINGVIENRLHPDTFKIPSREDKMAIHPGCYVKVGFVLKDHTPERMWLIVTSLNDDGTITGTLDNDPVFMPFTIGGKFTVSPDNVLALVHQEVKQ